ncbi:heme-binding protein [uncultured Pseudoteredinibacter sp.]|uniref:SOUL family heme-binding protein n=1 Tax=uncultured Pseudoteredinibacter sp. TaxID=1641701 RepID=UPI00261A6AFE|nr:heme-binding protein [uncultured Pseudoteredinibacter sp.]
MYFLKENLTAAFSPAFRTVKILKATVILSSSLFLAACSLVSANTEEASYNLLKADGNIEIRSYQNIVLVSTAMQSQGRDSGAFMSLFRYISGGNAGDEKIAMTAPVFMDTERKEKMSFVLPATYTFKDAPKPKDKSVNLEQWPQRTFAAIRFNGLLSPSNIAEHRDKLTQWLSSENIEVSGPAIMAGYDHPMTLPSLRRNEVLIPVNYSAN